MKNVWYLCAAYSTIWTALWVYMMRLSQHNKALQAALRDVRAQLERGVTKGGVLDVAMTIVDKQSKGVPMDE